MSNSNLETITDNLADGYKKLEKGTFQEASEIQNQRRKDKKLRSKWFYTANLPFYRLVDGKLEYGLSGRKAFDAIAGADIDKFTDEILNSKGHLFHLTEPQIQALSSLDIVWAKASDLELQGENDEWSFFRINTSDFKGKKLNRYQRTLAVKVHGSLKAKYYPEQEFSDYEENMRMLDKEGIKQTKLWLPNSNHIMKYLEPGKVVARACGLNSFDGSSDFGAFDRLVGSSGGALRGVPKIAEGGAQNLTMMIKTILKNPSEALKHIGAKEAAGFLNLANNFYNSENK